MRNLIFILAFGFALQCLADDNLNFQLSQAAAQDDLNAVLELLDQGADPLSYAPWQGYPIPPALHLAALSVAEKGKDQVYQEFLHRGLKPNSIGRYPVSLGSGEGESVWDFVLANLADPSLHENFENFFLRSLNEGADPFEGGVYRKLFSELIFRKFERVVAQIMSKGVSKQSWIWFTKQWTKFYQRGKTDLKIRQELIQIFRKYQPLIRSKGVQIGDWGDYKFQQGQLSFVSPVSFEFVQFQGGHVDREFLSEFKSAGFDLNQEYDGISTCARAEPRTIDDVNILLSFGCEPSTKWVRMALEGGHYQTANQLLTQGFDINQMYADVYEDHTVLTYFCANGSFLKDRPQIEWLLKNGANPNLSSSRGRLCLHEAVTRVPVASQMKESLELVKLLILYHADVNAPNPNWGKYRALSELGNMMERAEVTEEGRDFILQGVEVLLQAGANPNLIDENTAFTNDVPLLNFAGGSSPQATKAVQLLIGYGADPLLKTDQWASAFHLLAFRCVNSRCEMAMRQILEKAPGLLNLEQAIWSRTNSPLCYSVMSDNAITAEILLKMKADTQLKCESGQTPFKTSQQGSKVRQVFEKYGLHE